MRCDSRLLQFAGTPAVWAVQRLLTAIFGLLLLACSPVHAAEMILQIRPPDAELMVPPVSPPQIQHEGLPLSWEKSTVNGYFGYVDRGEYKEALAYLREKGASDKEGSFLDLIEKGDPGGRLKQRAVAGGLVQVSAEKGPIQEFGKLGQVSAYMLYLIGYTYFTLEKYQAAETAFLTALGPMPDYIRVHESLGLLYLRMKRYEDAGNHLARAAQLGLHTAELYGAMGYLYYQTGNFWGSASAFQKALMLKPGNGEWKRGQLQALSRTYQYQETLTLAESMLEEHPDDAGLWLFGAKAALQAGEKEKALSSLETAIRLGDKTGSNLRACAVLHMELGSVGRALDLLKGGFADGMDFVLVDQGMSRLENAEAWTSLEQVIGSVRNRWRDLDDLQRSRVLVREADISLHKGDKPAAGKALEKAIALDPSNGEALISMGDIQRGKGNYELAELLYRRAGAYGAYRERSLISLARLAQDRDDFKSALQILRDTLEAFPDRTDLNSGIETLRNLILLEEDGGSDNHE